MWQQIISKNTIYEVLIVCCIHEHMICTYKTNPQMFLKAQPVPSTGMRLWGEMETPLITVLWKHNMCTQKETWLLPSGNE